jgi:hypothetical protein
MVFGYSLWMWTAAGIKWRKFQLWSEYFSCTAKRLCWWLEPAGSGVQLKWQQICWALMKHMPGCYNRSLKYSFSNVWKVYFPHQCNGTLTEVMCCCCKQHRMMTLHSEFCLCTRPMSVVQTSVWASKNEQIIWITRHLSGWHKTEINQNRNIQKRGSV